MDEVDSFIRHMNPTRAHARLTRALEHGPCVTRSARCQAAHRGCGAGEESPEAPLENGSSHGVRDVGFIA